MDQSLQINFDSNASLSREKRFVHLSQREESGMEKTASMFDISQMIALARIGRSAHSYKKDACPAIITDTGVNFVIEFEAWPSFPTLNYTLESNIGHVSTPIIVSEYVEFSIVFGETDTVELDFMLENLYGFNWETTCYALNGTPIGAQIVTLEGYNILKVPIPIFGVVRITGKKIGAKHSITHTLINKTPVRPTEEELEEGIPIEDIDTYWGYTDVATWNGEVVNPLDIVNLTGLSITNLKIVITATWLNDRGEEETDKLNISIPQCIKDLLSTCGNLENVDDGGDGGTTICHKEHGANYERVYFSICSGKVLKAKTITSDDSWCK